MKKIILDTNAYSKYILANKLVLDALIEADKVYISLIVIGELYAGFKGGNKEYQNINYLNKFLNKIFTSVLPLTRETAEIFGEIKSKLKKGGTPIPVNDIWIAAQAIETGSTLITFDKHFQNIPGLRLWKEN